MRIGLNFWLKAHCICFLVLRVECKCLAIYRPGIVQNSTQSERPKVAKAECKKQNQNENKNENDNEKKIKKKEIEMEK